MSNQRYKYALIIDRKRNFCALKLVLKQTAFVAAALEEAEELHYRDSGEEGFRALFDSPYTRYLPCITH